MLSNPIYLGEIRHKKERHPGQHEPIVGRELWEKVQQHLRDQAATHRERPTKAPPSPLAGKLFDENGEPLYVQGAVKGARHYRYYVSRGLVRGSVQDDQRGWRVAAPELERAVRAATQRILGDRAAIAGAIEELDIDASRLPSIFKVAEAWIQSLRSEAEAASVLTRLIERVGLKQDGIQVSIKLPIPSDEGRDAATPNELALARFVPMRMKRRGVEMRLIIDGDAASCGPHRSTAAQRDRPCVSMVQRSAGGPGAVDRRDRQARTSYGPSRAARDAAGVSGAQDRRGDRRRPPACGPQHHRDDPKNRTAPALERAAASSGHPIDSRGRSCLRQAFFPSVRSPRCRPVRRWTCQNREQRILRDFCASAAAVGILRVHHRA